MIKIKDLLENCEYDTQIKVIDTYDNSEYNFQNVDNTVSKFGYYNVRSWKVVDGGLEVIIRSQF